MKNNMPSHSVQEQLGSLDKTERNRWKSFLSIKFLALVLLMECVLLILSIVTWRYHTRVTWQFVLSSRIYCLKIIGKEFPDLL